MPTTRDPKDEPVEVHPDRELLRRLGKEFFGERWLRPFAAALGVDHATLWPLVRDVDPRPLSGNMRARIVSFVDRQYGMLPYEGRHLIAFFSEARLHFASNDAGKPPLD